MFSRFEKFMVILSEIDTEFRRKDFYSSLLRVFYVYSEMSGIPNFLVYEYHEVGPSLHMRTLSLIRVFRQLKLLQKCRKHAILNSLTAKPK